MKNFNKKEWFKKYRKENKARIDQKLKEWKEKNKEKYGEYQKKFQSERYQKNKGGDSKMRGIIRYMLRPVARCKEGCNLKSWA